MCVCLITSESAGCEIVKVHFCLDHSKDIIIITITTLLMFQFLLKCVLVEERTREQRKSRVWHDQRAGRVTASVFREAAKTENSSSLIKRICYPQSSHFSTEATRYLEGKK